ncbi:N-acetylmuramic acid 6-phosphate etherase [Chitinophaga rhizophila]|uniref:N-acetylmuramic acid 6-phosphate etherase n=1 Tax=Chitinophaga rhizophila TaxID=2866212 RepID=A0ABS7GCC7_9BACT|nr:N-acetylmuramic acid 6-phosphate etherase [Chitinophaga rhizophila]MBW8685323.1 N-acetylmuramic acid 6-phosphate etherase [Chitinophaga rhizophila]
MLTTEMSSHFNDLEKMSVRALLEGINSEDMTVPLAVAKAIPQIELLVTALVGKMKAGGRLFYIGAGTSGRLGILDASECPPTFGVPHELVIGIIAGGDTAIRKAVEFAEDDTQQAEKDLDKYNITDKDAVVGIAASGTTPYVIGGVQAMKARGILTGCVTCNAGSPLAASVDYPVEAAVGAEFLTGSTRMKSGTAQKLILNMISTSVMIQLGRVKGNKMVDMQLSNHKLVDRATRMVMSELQIDEATARQLIAEKGSVRAAIESRK